jgi:type 1 glutamine amidotransferase
VKVAGTKHPVTEGVRDFEIFDETYKGYYVEEGVTPLLLTEEPSSNPLIGWAKKYGNSRIVVLQSGHDVPTFENPNFRKLLKQAIEWVY